MPSKTKRVALRTYNLHEKEAYMCSVCKALSWEKLKECEYHIGHPSGSEKKWKWIKVYVSWKELKSLKYVTLKKG